MKTDEQIRSSVMRRVYAIYWTRQLARPAPRVIVLVVLGTALISTVSVVNVAANAFAVRGLGELARFAYAAFLNTTPFVQGLSGAIAAMLAWFSIDGVRQVRFVLTPHEVEPAAVN